MSRAVGSAGGGGEGGGGAGGGQGAGVGRAQGTAGKCPGNNANAKKRGRARITFNSLNRDSNH